MSISFNMDKTYCKHCKVRILPGMVTHIFSNKSGQLFVGHKLCENPYMTVEKKVRSPRPKISLLDRIMSLKRIIS